MRFKFDENLPREMATLFANAGHDAVTVLDQQMGGDEDEDIAAVCLNEGRALVTLDLDFSDIRVYPPRRYPGLVVLRVSSQLREDLLQVGVRLLESLTTSLQGQLWIVEDSRIRIRE
ncbi:MAG: DUF5615 family PIN-like protein [Chloroflexota bacterium]|nr:DUF5615 family PIN-like protein [Chloroflexota bacterium]